MKEQLIHLLIVGVIATAEVIYYIVQGVKWVLAQKEVLRW